MITEKAYAKINTYLNVISKRADGYHNIVSVMQTVSLFDLVSVSFLGGRETKIDLTIIGNSEVPSGTENLAWRAADAFLKKAALHGKVCIKIEKNIPMAGGLAGGSADAAAVLRALYTLCDTPFSKPELYTLGATLGADIPFCIRGGCALVEGIGDRLQDAPVMPRGAHVVIARMGEGVSTPAAYGALDRMYGNFSVPSTDQRYLDILTHWSASELSLSFKSFYNIFEDAVIPQRPLVAKIKSVLSECGAATTLMSGSGPSVFGVFPDPEAAKQACSRLKEMGADAFLCEPCGQYPFSN